MARYARGFLNRGYYGRYDKAMGTGVLERYKNQDRGREREREREKEREREREKKGFNAWMKEIRLSRRK